MSPLRARLDRLRGTLREDGTLRAVLKHTAWLTGSTGGIIVLSAVQGILSARMLGVEVWGMLGIALSFSTVVGLLLSFRMHEFVVKWVTHFRADGTQRASTAFKLALAADVASALVAFGVVELLAGWGAGAFAKDPTVAWMFRSLALIVLFQAGQESLIGILQVNREFRVQSIIQTGSQALSAVGIAAVFLAARGLTGVVSVLVATAALTSLAWWVLGLRAARAVLKPGWMREKVVPLGEISRDMARFAVLGNIRGTLASVMNDGDLLVLGLLRNPVEVGYYKLAKAVCQIASLPNAPLVNASYPEFSAAAATRSWDDFRALIRRGSKVATLWIIPTSAALAVASPFLIGLLYGQAFVPAAWAVAILLVGVIVDGALFWGGASLLSLGEPGYAAGIGLWAAIVKYALAFLVVPFGGYLALAVVQSTVVTAMNAVAARRALVVLRARESES